MAKLTREQQIRQARAILDRSTTTRGLFTTNDLTELLTDVLPALDRAPARQRLASKASKAKFSTMETALRKVELINRELQELNPTGEWDQLTPVLEQRIAFGKQRLQLPLPPRVLHQRKTKTYAVNAAWLLLYDRDLPITRGRHSRWLKLATILYGDDSVDLYGSLQ